MDDKTLAIPKGLSPDGKKAARIILKVLKDSGLTYTGGCTTFYTPKQWRDRGEKYGRRSELLVVHDGGDVGQFFNYDYFEYAMITRMTEALDADGLWAEPCTNWYTAIFKE